LALVKYQCLQTFGVNPHTYRSSIYLVRPVAPHLLCPAACILWSFYWPQVAEVAEMQLLALPKVAVAVAVVWFITQPLMPFRRGKH
jgi:hypothetical protein